ncbi:MAG: ABC transporter permease, partial [Candidatus Micrarchaeia archaeon]
MNIKGYMRVILSMVELEIRRIMHDRTELYVRAVQPMLWLIIFGPVIGTLKVIPNIDIPYTDYIMPGVLVQSATTVAIFFGLVIIWERESGILKKLLASPSPGFAVVLGRSMAAGTRALFQALLIIPFSALIGVSIFPNPLYLIFALILVFIASIGFASLSILIASILKTRERFMGLGQLIIMPMFFASNALYPISDMPALLQVFANVNPMTYIVDALRGLLITGNLSQLALDIVAILLFDAILL